MYRTTKSKMRRRIPALVVVGALAAGGAVAGIGAAGAATHRAEATHRASAPERAKGPCDHAFAGGLVSAVSANSLTLTTPRGTATTFTLTSNTVVTKDRQSASLSDLAVGDHVRVRVSPTNATTATEVNIETPHILGQVVGVSGNVITLANPDGLQTTVDVTGATTYTKNGASATLSDVTVGSFIAARGTVASNHTTFDAANVFIGTPAGPMGAGFGGGEPAGPPPGGPQGFGGAY